MLALDEYLKLDAVGLGSLIQTGQLSPSEVLETAIARAESVNPTLNILVHKAYDEARATAAGLDPDRTNNLLYGVPFLVKAANAVRNWPRARGSRLFDGDTAAADSRVAARYREAGLLLFGQTNIPELCLTITTESRLHGPCHNPHNTEHSAGGSSGGSAAAVAAGVVPAADASDGGGSIRIPAACCGLFGLKPSRGLTVVEDDIGSAWSGMSVNHVVTRSVRDSAAFLDLLRLQAPALFALPDGSESYYLSHSRAPGPLRVALHRTHPGGAEVHPDCLAALDYAASLCEKAGFHVEEQTPPVNYEALGQAMGELINIHVAQIIMPQLEKRQCRLEDATLEEATRRMAARGAKASATHYLQAIDTLRRAERQMNDFHQHVDLVLSPVLTMPAAPLGWLDMDGDIRSYASRFSEYSGFTALYNGTGQPSLSVPVHQNPDGLPIGVMFSAGWGNDHLLLQVGAMMEQMSGPWMPVATV